MTSLMWFPVINKATALRPRGVPPRKSVRLPKLRVKIRNPKRPGPARPPDSIVKEPFLWDFFGPKCFLRESHLK